MGSSSKKSGSVGDNKSSGSGGYVIAGNSSDDVNDEKKKKTEESSELTIDKSSINALGYGPISASKLNSLVESGEVIEYVEGGKLKYRKNTSLINLPTNNVLNKFKR